MKRLSLSRLSKRTSHSHHNSQGDTVEKMKELEAKHKEVKMLAEEVKNKVWDLLVIGNSFIDDFQVVNRVLKKLPIKLLPDDSDESSELEGQERVYLSQKLAEFRRTFILQAKHEKQTRPGIKVTDPKLQDFIRHIELLWPEFQNSEHLKIVVYATRDARAKLCNIVAMFNRDGPYADYLHTNKEGQSHRESVEALRSRFFRVSCDVYCKSATIQTLEQVQQELEAVKDEAKNLKGETEKKIVKRELDEVDKFLKKPAELWKEKHPDKPLKK
ncbi:uncharacterized protein FOMMEDRAFT_28291 [Fomitiporia mediterranea MF3/22]|uniref:uncharacterized protein n=1 Tax=Fomitiporia mediterranea (strain MF3/22) TaxID=694068 RepID=UPI0004408034|nr:uncharacterized protein FOMMEDRAFT_28291 [Fomitiporia mediterranea MF3/22]EJD04649.1 hypothetical protein FOMMEDRAFT_28291 [Fomitiporia mediterranea MF3/22]